MVVVLRIELSAVDQSHRHLQAFMEGTGTLKFRWRLRHRLYEFRAPRSQFSQYVLDTLRLVPKRELLEPSPNRRGVHLFPLPKVFQSFLP